MGLWAAKVTPNRRARCLLVEDSDFDHDRIVRVLDQAAANELHIARTLGQARYALSKNRFDLILLDNGLPDGSGADFAMELQKHAGFSQIPVILISDWTTPFMYDKAMLARVRMVLRKDEFRPIHVQNALRWVTPEAKPRR